MSLFLLDCARIVWTKDPRRAILYNKYWQTGERPQAGRELHAKLRGATSNKQMTLCQMMNVIP